MIKLWNTVLLWPAQKLCELCVYVFPNIGEAWPLPLELQLCTILDWLINCHNFVLLLEVRVWWSNCEIQCYFAQHKKVCEIYVHVFPNIHEAWRCPLALQWCTTLDWNINCNIFLFWLELIVWWSNCEIQRNFDHHKKSLNFVFMYFPTFRMLVHYL